MSINGQLSTGLVKLVRPGSGELLGYAFTVAGGRGQLQRWLLHQNPQNTFEIVPPPPEMARWTLADWQANVPSLWRAGSFYVWAQTDVYEHGASYTYENEDPPRTVRWDAIPAELPAPTYPRQGGDFQLDPTGYHVINVLQWDTAQWGLAFTEGGLRDAEAAASGRARSAEYWYLPPGFRAAGAASRTSIGVGTLVAPRLPQFVALANERWAPGAALAITGCKSYFGQLPPGEP